MTQARLDEMAGLPLASVSKIENGKRAMSAVELIRVAKALKVRITAFLGREVFVCKEEIKMIQAFRELNFEDYKRFMIMLEAQIYFASKEADGEKKEYLGNLVKNLSEMSLEDKRPQEQNIEKLRIRHKKINKNK